MKKSLAQCICMVVGSIFSFSAHSAELPHDQVEKITSGVSWKQSTWQPKLYKRRGCNAYAAVDAAGNYSGGLSATGSESGGCTHDGKGQTYSRAKCWDKSGREICALMYTWYFPKDMFMAGSIPIANAGHRHDWENVIIWTDNNTFAGAGYSQHGDYEIHGKNSSSNLISGKTLSVEYDRDSGTHAIQPTSASNGTIHLGVSWDRLPSAAKDTLVNHGWGGAVFPLKDSSFLGYIRESIPDNLRNDYGFSESDVQ